MYTEKTKDGRVKYLERYLDPLTGKYHRVSVVMDKDTRTSRKIAEGILREKIAGKTSQSSKEYSLQELVEIYYTFQSRERAVGTAERNHATLKRMLQVLGADVLASRLTAGYINEKLLATGKPAGTLNEQIQRLKALLRWAYENDYVEDISFLNKLRAYKEIPHKVKIQDKYLEKDELNEVLASMDACPVWQLLTKFLAYSGLRFGEACALEKSDVDLTDRVIRVTKCYDSNNEVVSPAKSFESVRDVHIQPELMDVCRQINSMMLRRRLACRIGDSRLFLFGEDGEHIAYFAYRKYLKAKCAAITGKTITPHALRHTHASLLYEAGFTIDEVARRLGHADSKVTREIYTHVTRKLREKDNARLDQVSFS